MPFATEAELEPTVRIKLLYFASLRDVLTRDAEEADVPASLRVLDLLPWLRKRHPLLESDVKASAVLDSCACAINADYLDADTAQDRCFANGDEVSLIPPVSGG